jgi:hypothetical protein
MSNYTMTAVTGVAVSEHEKALADAERLGKRVSELEGMRDRLSEYLSELEIGDEITLGCAQQIAEIMDITPRRYINLRVSAEFDVTVSVPFDYDADTDNLENDLSVSINEHGDVSILDVMSEMIRIEEQ